MDGNPKVSPPRAVRVPLSGASHYRSNGADVDIYVLGPEAPPPVSEARGP